MVKNAKYIITLGLALALCACDNAEEQASSAAQQPQAGEEAMVAPAAPTDALPEGVPGASGEAPAAISGDLNEGAGSMDDASPAGDAVTENELPQSDVPPPSREAFTDESCAFEAWVGKPVDEAAVKATGRIYRILKPDSMMTMDHNPDRINVVHGDDGIVTRVWCG